MWGDIKVIGSARLQFDHDKIAAFCCVHQIRRFVLFGRVAHPGAPGWGSDSSPPGVGRFRVLEIPRHVDAAKRVDDNSDDSPNLTKALGDVLFNVLNEAHNILGR